MPNAIYVETPADCSYIHKLELSQEVESQCYSIRLCTSGACELLIHQQLYRYACGDFLVILPSSPVQVISREADFAEYALYLAPNMSHDLVGSPQSLVYTQLAQHPCYTLDAESTYLLRKHLELISCSLHLSKSHAFQRSALWLLIDSFQLKCYELFYKSLVSQSKVQEEVQLAADLALFVAFFRAVCVHHTQHRQVDFYIGYLACNRDDLVTSIQRLTGEGPKQWITKVSMRFIKALLIETDLTTKEVAHRYHFSSASAFCSFFKNQTEMSPLEFRNRYRPQTQQ